MKCHMAALLAATTLATIPAIAFAHRSPAVPVRQASEGGTLFVFGRTGGNIRPFTVTIARSGAVSTMGTVSSQRQVTLSKDALHGLLKLAKAENFSGLPSTITGTAVLPDVASLYITVHIPSGTKTVTEHGARNARFDQLFAVLMAAAGASLS